MFRECVLRFFHPDIIKNMTISSALKSTAMASAALFLIFAATGCSGSATSDDEIKVSEVRAVETRDLGHYRGIIRPYRTVSVSTRTEGVLQKMYFAEGAEVTKGQLLFQIDPTVYQALVNKAAANVSKAVANERKAQRDLDRIRPLFQANAASQLDLDNAENAYENARAEVQTAHAELELARLNLNNTTVRAPISGFISRSSVDVGSYVSPSSGEITSIINVDTINVEFSLSAVEYQLSRHSGICFDAYCTNPAHETNYYVTVTDTDGELHPETGRVNFAAHRTDRDDGNILIRAAVPNMPHSLMPGTYTDVTVVSGNKHRRIVVPRSAVVQSDSATACVYIIGPDNVASKRNVMIGDFSKDSVFVSSGLKEGENIAVSNVSAIVDGKKYDVTQ